MTTLRVYVAGPYTADPEACTATAIAVGNAVLDAGHAPFVPHLAHYWETKHAARPYEDWMRIDLAWLAVADVVVRIPGDSSGADREVTAARSLGIPVTAWGPTTITELAKALIPSAQSLPKRTQNLAKSSDPAEAIPICVVCGWPADKGELVIKMDEVTFPCGHTLTGLEWRDAVERAKKTAPTPVETLIPFGEVLRRSGIDRSELVDDEATPDPAEAMACLRELTSAAEDALPFIGWPGSYPDKVDALTSAIRAARALVEGEAGR